MTLKLCPMPFFFGWWPGCLLCEHAPGCRCPTVVLGIPFLSTWCGFYDIFYVSYPIGPILFPDPTLEPPSETRLPFQNSSDLPWN